MAEFPKKALLPPIAGLLGIICLIVLAFVTGYLSAQSAALTCIVLCVVATFVANARLQKAAREAKLKGEIEPAPSDSLTSMKTARRTRTLEIAIGVLLSLLIYGLWTTRGGPILPRLIGTAVNLWLVGSFSWALHRQKQKAKNKPQE